MLHYQTLRTLRVSLNLVSQMIQFPMLTQLVYFPLGNLQYHHIIGISQMYVQISNDKQSCMCIHKCDPVLYRPGPTQAIH